MNAGLLVVMASSCAGHDLGVLDGWELFGQPRRRGAARQLTELTGEVRLVVVPARRGDVSQARTIPALEQAARPVEAQHTRRDLGRQSHLALEPLRQMPPAPADFRRQ